MSVFVVVFIVSVCVCLLGGFLVGFFLLVVGGVQVFFLQFLVWGFVVFLGGRGCTNS